MKYLLEYNEYDEINEYDIFLDEYNNWLDESYGHEEDIISENIVLDIFSDKEFMINFSNDLDYFTLEESLEIQNFINNNDYDTIREGFGDVMKKIANNIKKSPAVIGQGLKTAAKATGDAIKGVGSSIKIAGKKIADAAKAVKDFISVILKEFNKTFMVFSKAAEQDVRVAATWTIQKYHNIARAAKKAKKDEKTYFENVIKYFENIKNKVKDAFTSGVQQGVKESLLYDDGIFDLLNEDLTLKPTKKILKKITKTVDNTMKKQLVQKDDDHGPLPKGTKGKIFHNIEMAVYKVGDIIDIIEKNITGTGLKAFAHGLAAAGGPSVPENNFPHTSLIYTYSGIHHSGKGGILKNWKTPLRMALNHGATKGGVALAATATAPLSIIGLGIGTLVKVLGMVKKSQITAMILKMSSGDEEMAKITKRSTKMFSGGLKHYFAKNA